MDLLARLYAQRMAESWGQQVVVDNRSGAGGIVGRGAVLLEQLAGDLVRWTGSADPALMVVGDTADVAAAIEPFFTAGATCVLLQPREGETDLASFMANVGVVSRLVGDG